MSAPIVTNDRVVPQSTETHAHGRKYGVWLAIVVAVIVVGLLAVVDSRLWPFCRESVLQDLEEATDSRVTVDGFHSTYFPSPGCVIDGLTFLHGPQQVPLIKIQKLTVNGSYLDILRRHVPRLVVEGARVFVPAFGTPVSFNSKHSSTVIDELIANGTMVEFASGDPKEPPMSFDIHDAVLNNVRWDHPILYDLKFHNPQPPGEITTRGSFGAWPTGNPGATPLSGEYKFDHADLSVYGGISGILHSSGKFEGTLQHVNIDGETETPDFMVTSSSHRVKLLTKFHAYVDATRGDTFLKQVDAEFGRTNVIVNGSIAGAPGIEGKVAKLDLVSHRGRIEDVLDLFVTAPRSPMSGNVSTRARVTIAPGDKSFLQKVSLQGAFGIDEGGFSNADTQKSVDQLSAGARGQNKEDPETVMTDLKGQVVLKNAVAQFSQISFKMPGAAARMQGTYNIENYKINLHGRMRVDTKISKTSSGVKALLLKVMDPIFKKKKRGEIVPIHIAGTYDHPEFGLDLGKSGPNNTVQK